MRPVNLIPPEDRRGDQAPLRRGPLVYVLLGGLGALLVGVVCLVLVGNQVSERETEVAKLEREDRTAATRAVKLAAYREFQSLSEARLQTVEDLADSRFDWERVMRELALVLPGDVTLTDLTASAAGGEGSEGTAGLNGPSLEMSGCAAGQKGVAGFITALKDIDGVTRVGLQSSTAATSEGGGGAEGCEGTVFAVVVAFDAAPLPPSGEAVEAAPESAPEAAQVASSETSEGGG